MDIAAKAKKSISFPGVFMLTDSSESLETICTDVSIKVQAYLRKLVEN